MDIAPMRDADHLDDDSRVIDGIHDSPVSLPYPVERMARELLTPVRSRVLAQAFDALQDAPDIPFRQSLQILRDRSLEAQLKACHRP